MFIQVLVDDKIKGGLAIVDALRQEKVPVSAAFWCRIPESGYWRLVIASQLIDRIGPLEGYRRLHEILRRLDLWEVFSGSVSLLSPSDPTFRSLQEYAQGPGQFGVSVFNGPPDPFQDAYFYHV